MGEQRWRALVQKRLVGRTAALGDKQEVVAVLAFFIDVDLGGEVGLGVLLLEHGKRSELRIAQVPALIGVHHAARQCLVIAALGPDLAALLGHDDRGSRILAHRQYAAGCNVGVLEQVEGDETIVLGRFRIVQNRCELLEMTWPEQMVDVAEGRFGKKAQTVHIDRQDLLAAEFLDADMLVGQFLPGGGVGSKREEIVCHGIPFRSPVCRCDGGPVLG
jgi:hypothetical protein